MQASPQQPAAFGRTDRLDPGVAKRIQQVHLRTHRLMNTALAGSYRSTFRGSGIEFEEVRPYIPGDDVRSIDWNVTARTGEPFVKLFREERELTVNLIVDTAITLDFGTQQWSKLEGAAQLTALITMVALQNQDRVGLTLFGSEPGLHLQPSKGIHHTQRLIRSVMTAPVAHGRSDYTAVLQAAERTLHRRSLLFFISDFHAAAHNPEWVETLARLERRHDVIAVRVVDPLEESLPDVGRLRLGALDGPGHLEVDTSSAAVRDAWEHEARERKRVIQAELARARVSHFDLDLGGNLADPLVAFFRRREMSRGGR